MNYKTCFFCFCLVSGIVLPHTGFAQKNKKEGKSVLANKISLIAKNYEDSISYISQYYEKKWKYTHSDTLANPYYFHLFCPTIVSSKQLKGTMSMQDSTKSDNIQREIENIILQSYVKIPSAFQYEDFKNVNKNNINVLSPSDISSENIQNKINTNPNNEIAENFAIPGAIDIITYKPNFWSFKTDFSMQFMQTHVSKNWYNGGESNFSLLGTWNIEANYNNKQKITFDNKLEMKLGFQTSKSDKMHKFKTNNDLLRMTNKFGLRATSHWSYTLMLQSWTQFYPGYKSNDAFVYSDFLSPLDCVFTIGMGYKTSFRKANMDITLSPFAYNMRYVGRSTLSTSFGLKEGQHAKHTFGSNITANYSWNIAKNIQWTSRFYYFTDYKKVQAEWENTFILTINKFLSTKLFVYPRYDDGVARTDGHSYFQFSEWLSFGLNLSFK